ncbi:MAG: VWA domain-containing protein [Candidatus Anammoximicrobium sp.]|nr:VWA domain-containing protein [Candidatus Anammoximicrobium sp.]
MLRRSALALLVSPVMALAVAIAADAPGDANSAKLSTYESPAGDAYFALSLPPVAGQAAAFDHDVVVLFDTSASQTGAYRDDALQSLKTLLGQLGKSDRVKLMAVDLDAVPMTPDFVAPGSDEMKAGLAKLEGRAPLGSTDMRSALKGAADSFTGAPARPRCVVYIGDGISRANVLQPSDLAATVQTLLDKRASVSSFAIGPGRDVHLLAAVANHTGGMVYLDSSEGHWAERAGQAMADVVRTPVYWPTEVKLPEAIREAYPKTMPPLRGDRDTVVIGLLQSRDVKDVSLTAEVDGKPVKLSWNVAVNNALDDYSFLPQLVDGARDNGGIGLPTLGSASLQEVAKMASANNELLAKLGRNALRVGDKEGALKVADAVLKRDPNHPQAQLIRDAAQRQGNGADDADLRLVNLQDPAAPDAAPPAPGGVGGLLAEVQAGGGDFLANVENSRQVLEQKLKTEVELAVNQARDQMGTNPEGAKRELKIQLETIEKSPDLGPDTRAQLKNQIESAIREAGRKAIEVAARTALAEENRAAAEERQQLVEETARTQQKIRQLMDRFNNLIDEGRYTEAEDIIAAQVRELDPFGTAPLAATWAARIGGHWNTMWAVREVRARNFARSLMEVEKAAVPFPDDPPVGYPEAQVWADLTLRRKKYASIDLARQGSAEQKIFSALEDDTRLEFIETPLNSVIDFLKDQHDINIEIDTKALDDIGVGTDSPITRNLKGISLRSALRLMLKDLGLTYVVKDEVLLITTPEEAESKLVTKVYPVGDLVIPIQSGMMGGMMGGMGGGMMGGGMGGGMFAVEDDLSLGVKKSPTAPAAPAQTESPLAPAKPAKVEKIDLQLEPGQTLEDAWNAYFENLKKASADAQQTARLAVRETARQLMKQEKFQDVTVLLMAALRNGFPQTWMYEGLGLAMKASGAPDSEVERALMSVVDFSGSLDETLYVAEYLTQLGLDRRALQVYQSLAAAQPLRPEPYVRGLAAAQRLDEIPAIQWACVGILGQAWPAEQIKIQQTAARVTRATYERLLADNRREEAEAFHRQIQQALIRDCVIRVAWTGDADIDLLVEEPTGTVCSADSPRTPGGGVMIGDVFAKPGVQPAEGYSEYYVCPEGFSGQYRLMVKRIWGEPTAGKVTVEIAKQFGSEKQKIVSKHLPLTDDRAVVVFSLTDGRRKDALDEQQIAAVARVQHEFSRALLGQQLAAYENSDAVRDYLWDAIQAQRDGRLPRRGGVGYRPVITTLPEGANFYSSAVISADRRYVRVTPMPIFSLIGEVNTFTYSGDTDDQDMGGGMGGGMGGMGGGMSGGMGGGGGMGGFGGGGMF